MKKTVILRGVPGAGKSTAAKQMFVEQGLAGIPVTTFSADYYFERSGEYQFDPSKLGAAHASCLRAFVLQLTALSAGGDGILVIDNTNTTVQEVDVYVKLARAFDVPFEVVTVQCDPALAAARGLHGVPTAKVWEMHRRLMDAKIPRDWPHRVIQSEVR